MHKILNFNERFSLLESHKKEKVKSNADRIKSVLLYDEGWTFSQIAKALFISEDTTARYVHDYKEKKKLASDYKGSAPLLNQEKSHLLSVHLQETLYLKIKDIQGYVLKTWGLFLSIPALHRWLKRHGFSYKKPRLR
jgi:transposase